MFKNIVKTNNYTTWSYFLKNSYKNNIKDSEYGRNVLNKMYYVFKEDETIKYKHQDIFRNLEVIYHTQNDFKNNTGIYKYRQKQKYIKNYCSKGYITEKHKQEVDEYLQFIQMFKDTEIKLVTISPIELKFPIKLKQYYSIIKKNV